MKKKIFGHKIFKQFWFPIILVIITVLVANLINYIGQRNTQHIPYFEDTPEGKKVREEELQYLEEVEKYEFRQNLNYKSKKPENSFADIPVKTDIKEELLNSFGDDVVFGNKKAPVTIIEYSSFTCGHCVDMHNTTMKKLQTEYINTSKVKLIHRTIINQKTIFGAMIQHCVKKNHLNNLTNDLFNESSEWTFGDNFLTQLKIIASRYEIDEQKFNECIKNTSVGQSILDKQLLSKQYLQINATPILFVNKERIVGKVRYKKLQKIINQKLEEIDND